MPKKKKDTLHETLTPADVHSSSDPDTLFDISTEMKLIIREITEAQADKNLDLVSELTDELLNIMDQHEDKYEAYVHVIKNSLNGAAGNKEIADIFGAKATALNNLAKRLKETLVQDLKQHGLTKADAGIFTIRTQKNSIPTLDVKVSAEELPERFHTIEVNKEELRFALANGEKIEGATLETGVHLRIGPKV